MPFAHALEAVTFVTSGREKPTIVMSADDPHRAIRERLCAEHQSAIRSVEFTSDEARQRRSE